MFLRDSCLQKTKDIFLMPEDNLLKQCIFEITIKLCVYVQPKHILLNQNKPERQRNIPQKKTLKFPYGIPEEYKKYNQHTISKIL